jgi:hypothetical protein
MKIADTNMIKQKQKQKQSWDTIHKEWESPTTSQLQKEIHLSSEQ